MENRILTVIIPIYNKQNLLRQCLDSFAVKSFTGRLEVLAIDDGSSDASLSIALEYNMVYPEIFKVIHKENGGVGSVMNTGLKNASGKYIKEVDADDYVHSDAMEDLLNFLGQCDSDMVLNPFEVVDASGNYLKTHHITGLQNGKTYLLDEVLGKTEICIQNVTVRRQLLSENGFSFEETRYYVDVQFVSDSIYYAKTCTAVNRVLYCYRINQAEQSVSLESYIKNKDSFRRQTELLLQRAFYAKGNAASAAKEKRCRDYALGYGAMLYMIYLMDGAEEADEEIKKFDDMFREKYPDLYAACGTHALLRDLRKGDFKNTEFYRARIGKTIKELRDVNNGNAGLGDVCSIELNHNTIDYYRMQRQRDKFQKYYQVLNVWFKNYQEGITIDQYLLKQGFHKIAIYGFGALGERLYQELADSGVRVLYGIDRRTVSQNDRFQICQLSDELEEVDAVVVTVVTDFANIAMEIRKKMNCPVLSLEDIIYGS